MNSPSLSNTSPGANARGGAAQGGAMPTTSRLVTDAPTRMFHALFGLCFAGAYITAESEHWRALHVTLGYSFGGLFVFRLLYGMFGPRQARLGVLWRKVAAGPAWVRGVLAKRSLQSIPWRQGQFLAVGATIVMMLALVLPLTLSGYANYNDWGDRLGGDWIEDVHELLANALLTAVLVHIGLIALLSVLRRENQALSMLTGRLAGTGPSPVKHNRAWLAALLLLAVLGFGAWQWQSSPRGLVPWLAGPDAQGVDIRGAFPTEEDDEHDD